MSRADPRAIAAWKVHRETIVVPAGNGFRQQAEAEAARCQLPVTTWAREVLEAHLAERRCQHTGAPEPSGEAEGDDDG